MAYLNTHDISKMEEDIKQLNDVQFNNLYLYLYFKLKLKSVNHNKFFDHMSMNYQQINRMNFLKECCFKKKFLNIIF